MLPSDNVNFGYHRLIEEEAQPVPERRTITWHSGRAEEQDCLLKCSVAIGRKQLSLSRKLLVGNLLIVTHLAVFSGVDEFHRE